MLCGAVEATAKLLESLLFSTRRHCCRSVRCSAVSGVDTGRVAWRRRRRGPGRVYEVRRKLGSSLAQLRGKGRAVGVGLVDALRGPAGEHRRTPASARVCRARARGRLGASLGAATADVAEGLGGELEDGGAWTASTIARWCRQLACHGLAWPCQWPSLLTPGC